MKRSFGYLTCPLSPAGIPAMGLSRSGKMALYTLAMVRPRVGEIEIHFTVVRIYRDLDGVPHVVDPVSQRL